MSKVYVHCRFQMVYTDLQLQQNPPTLPFGNHNNTLYHLQLVSHTIRHTRTYRSSWYT